MSAPRYYFTVTAGRSGQASLTEMLAQAVPGCLALFEEPQVRPVLPRALGDIERRFRRRFVETHELLGRGRVLRAFERDDQAALDRFAVRRLEWIDRQVARAGAQIYVDVSKYFCRGLHRAIARVRPDIGVIRLVRDPILNMCSFLARDKNFYLDNASPACPHNQLILDPDDLDAGGLYLWAWSETYLRFDNLVAEFGLSPAVEIRTDDLNDPAALALRFDALGLPHGRIAAAPPRNTNLGAGHGKTVVRAEHIEIFERFRDRLPPETVARIAYFDDYDPRARFAAALAGEGRGTPSEES